MAKGGRRQSVVDRKLEKKVSFKNFFSLLPKEKKSVKWKISFGGGAALKSNLAISLEKGFKSPWNFRWVDGDFFSIDFDAKDWIFNKIMKAS